MSWSGAGCRGCVRGWIAGYFLALLALLVRPGRAHSRCLEARIANNPFQKWPELATYETESQPRKKFEVYRESRKDLPAVTCSSRADREPVDRSNQSRVSDINGR